MINKITSLYRRVAFSEHTGYMLNYLTLQVKNKEARAKVQEVNNQYRFRLLLMFVFIYPILRLPFVALNIFGKYIQFVKQITGVILFLCYFGLKKLGYNFLDNYFTTLVFCVFAILPVLIAEGFLPSPIPKLDLLNLIGAEGGDLALFAFIENDFKMNLAKVPVFCVCSYLLILVLT